MTQANIGRRAVLAGAAVAPMAPVAAILTAAAASPAEPVPDIRAFDYVVGRGETRYAEPGPWPGPHPDPGSPSGLYDATFYVRKSSFVVRGMEGEHVLISPHWGASSPLRVHHSEVDLVGAMTIYERPYFGKWGAPRAPLVEAGVVRVDAPHPRRLLRGPAPVEERGQDGHRLDRRPGRSGLRHPADRRHRPRPPGGVAVVIRRERMNGGHPLEGPCFGADAPGREAGSSFGASRRPRRLAGAGSLEILADNPDGSRVLRDLSTGGILVQTAETVRREASLRKKMPPGVAYLPIPRAADYRGPAGKS